MNLKSIGTSFAVAATVVAGTMLAASSAYALSIGEAGDELSISGRARFNTGTGDLDFAELVLGSPVFTTPTGEGTVAAGSTGEFAAFVGKSVVLKDFSLASVGANKWSFAGSLSEFINVDSDAIKFDLFTFDLERGAGGDWIASLTGQFQGGLSGIGEFDPVNNRNFVRGSGTPYTLDITAVPTPAMIPGLIGMGLAALRKRKDESSAEAES
jgi:hypothetical protein